MFQISLIHPLAAIGCPAEAGYFVVVFNIELVVIIQLFTAGYSAVGENDDAQVSLDFDGLSHAVGVAAVVDVTGQTTGEGGVDDALLVQPEHVNAAVLGVVALLAALGQLGADHLADVLDDHRVLLDVPGRVEAQSLDLGARQVDVVAPLLLHFLVL